MTLDQAIERLQDIRNTVGGDAPFCIERERTPSGSIVVFGPAGLDVYNVVKSGDKRWCCLMNGNSTWIIAAF